jgi:hypothetical protein
MTGFWKKWLDVWCIGVGVFGLVFAASAFPATEGPTRLFYDLVYWPIDGASGWDEATRFTASILGAVTFGWAITLHALVQAAHATGSRAIWAKLTTAFVAWYVVDSAVSIACGVPGNAVSNTLIIAGGLLPIMASGVLKAPTAQAV